MKLAVFDLDYTVWQPEMYQLRGKPRLVEAASQPRWSPKIILQARTKENGMILTDGNEPMRVFPGANMALTDIKRMQSQNIEIRAAVASRTDEPRWATVCMDYLVLEDGSTLASCFENRVEISYGSKVEHITRLAKKTGVEFSQMSFFDNEYSNIKDVSRKLPKVKCYYTPSGMTEAIWEQAKADFGMS